MFWLEDSSRLLPTQYAKRIRAILQKLDTANIVPDDFINLHSAHWNIHRLKGNLQEYWSLTVSGNYRIIFQFKDGDAFDVDYVDYH